jgi:hypothetical protein
MVTTESTMDWHLFRVSYFYLYFIFIFISWIGISSVLHAEGAIRTVTNEQLNVNLWSWKGSSQEGTAYDRHNIYTKALGIMTCS